eukprot:234036-Prorocentrum_minimum.AAC.1
MPFGGTGVRVPVVSQHVRSLTYPFRLSYAQSSVAAAPLFFLCCRSSFIYLQSHHSLSAVAAQAHHSGRASTILHLQIVVVDHELLQPLQRPDGARDDAGEIVPGEVHRL